MTENFSVQAETCRPFPNFFSATVVTQKFTTIVIPGNPGEGRGRPGIQEFKGIWLPPV
jgi:hypothetical protein